MKRGPDLNASNRRGSNDPSAAKAAAIAAAVAAEPSFGPPDGVTRIALLECNYDEFHLPPDLAILQLDIVSFFMLPDSASSPTHALASVGASSPTAADQSRLSSSPRRTGSLSCAQSVPPAATFGRLNPVKVDNRPPDPLCVVESNLTLAPSK